MGSTPRGGTRWKRFAVVMVPSVAAAAAVGIGLAQGALAASFTVSGQEFKVAAGHLEGHGFSQYGGVVEGYETVEGGKKVPRPVAISSFDRAEINDLCQSLATEVPLLGTVYMRIDAGNTQGEPVEATQLYLDIAKLEADATFTNMDIGVAVKDKTRGPARASGVKDGQFSQQAELAVLDNAEQTAWATTAGTFTLRGLNLRLGTDPKMECF
ncbi:cholesterol esterase [Streptomyces ruber]|uniref:Cholesterol esterase n=2 Tax=Streptomyces TaxID=1883 RepID=A0A918ER39_9ACTN|nr:DUF6230 family protein [Streptomyces ruber]GGQ42833.1 cholesterol esterase [Streptomyces ruber]